MKRKGLDLIAWSAAVIVSLLLAFWASLPKGEDNQTKVPVITLKPAVIAAVELSGPGVRVVANKMTEPLERWWISYERGVTDAAGGKGSETAESERFVASGKFRDFLVLFAPMQAIRVLGRIADEKLSDYGLKEGTKNLVLKDAQGSPLLTLTIGKQLYGGRNLYVLNQSDQKVLLIGGELISDFEKPELRFFERALTSLALEDLKSGTLIHGGKTKRFVHSSRDAKGAQIWSADGSAGDPLPQVSAWFERLSQLKAATYASDKDEEALKALSTLFEVRLEGGGADAEVVQLKRRGLGKDVEYWAHSSYLNRYVKVASTRAEALEKDVPQILQDQ